MFKKLILLAAALSLLGLSGAVSAAVSNPEDFESYSPSADWQPYEANEGWEIIDYDVNDANIVAKIGAYGPASSQALKYEAIGMNSYANWYATQSIASDRSCRRSRSRHA